MIKLVVFGGRDFCVDENREYITEHILRAFKTITKTMANHLPENTFVIDGVALGADEVGYRWRMSNNLDGERYPAKWKDEEGNFNRLAGFERNTLMVEAGNHFIGFWDGKSNGTNDTRKKVLKKGLPIRMFHYEVIDDELIITHRKDWEKL